MSSLKTFYGVNAEILPFHSEQIVNKICRSVRQINGVYIISDPTNAEFYWGNYIHLDEPDSWTIDQLQTLYKAQLPYVKNRFLFSWNDTLDLSRSRELRSVFEAAGYNFEASVCLVTEATNLPDCSPSALPARILKSDDDWQSATYNQFLCRTAYDDNTRYIMTRMQASRRAIEQGHGQWMGVFDGDKLVCDLGIFWEGSFCRFQAVGTHPDYRGQGIARHLVMEAVRDIARKRSNPLFIILTGLGGRPQKVYEKCGSYPVSTHVGFMKLKNSDS